MEHGQESSEMKLGLFRNAAVLAFAGQLRKLCDTWHDNLKYSEQLKDWREKFYQNLTSKSNLNLFNF